MTKANRMRLIKACLGACLAVGLSNASLAGDTLGEAAELEDVVSTALKEFQIPGAAIGVWTSSGQWSLVTGVADVATGRPVKRVDHFGIRSITKSFVVTALLQLVARSGGELRLDDPISKYLSGVPNGDQITLRELANMTSGLYDYTADAEFREAFGADPARFWTTDELLALAFNDTSHKPTNFEPGARYQYSNTNTLVLGKLVEVLTGKSFEDVLCDQILLPLKLKSTAYLSGTKLPRPAARGYQGTNEDGLPANIVVSFSALGFAGAMASTLDDLAGWGSALADGSLLPADLQQERFVANAITADPSSPVYDAYGLGIGQVAGWWGHTGEGVGFEAAVFHQIERNETFAVLLNASDTSDVPVRIFCRVLEVLGEAPPPQSGRVCASGNGGGFR